MLVQILFLLATTPTLISALCTIPGRTKEQTTPYTADCYVDSYTRILGPIFRQMDELNPWYCAQLCSDAGFTLAGTEDGNQCMCGNKLLTNAKKAPPAECNVKCGFTPNTKATCGGNWRLDLFPVNCSGSPEPQPTLTPYLNNPCLDTTKSFKDQPWCDSSLGYSERIADMLSRMTLTEKISALDTVTPTIDSLGINAYNWWSEATHGISHNRNSDKTPYESNFAFPITTAMAYNRSLWHATGFQIGLEGRAFMNNGDAWSTFWAPVINLAREPRWGRNIETPGEDPYLSGEYATEFVQGFQNHPDDPKHLMASACCKHYVANSMEDTKQQNIEWTRHDYDATITQQDLVDSYMPAFQACVEKGKVSSLMCSYNSVNGVPSCANDWLLKDIARDAWHFDGYITSDCDADEDVFGSHHYTKTPEETVADVLHAGTDVDCTSFVGAHAMSALNQSLITEEDIDERLAMLWRVRLRLSHFDPLGPLNAIPPSAVCSASAIELARDGARQGSTLLKNEGAVLPLNANKLSTVAVIGPNSNMSEAVAHYYGGNTCGNHYYNMIDAVATYMTASGTVSSLGVPTVNSNDTSGVAASAKQAAAADQTVLVLGTDLTDAREGSDATTLAFSEGQLALIEAVAAACAAAKKPPLVVVTITAVPLDISALLSDARIGAILHVGQPSVQTLGIGDVLFGATSPAGRTIQTIYPASYVDGISIFDFNMRPGPSTWSRPDCTKANASECPRGTNPGRTLKTSCLCVCCVLLCLLAGMGVRGVKF